MKLEFESIAKTSQGNGIELPPGFEFKYKEPFWSAKPPYPYALEVMKEGSIIGNIELSQKGCYLIGRAPVCDIILDHDVIKIAFFPIFQNLNLLIKVNQPTTCDFTASLKWFVDDMIEEVD